MDNLNYINTRIWNEVCEDTILYLSDEKLMTEYIQYSSVQKKIDLLKHKFM